MLSRCLTACVIAAVLALNADVAFAETGSIGRAIANFALRDYRGKEYSLAELGDSPLVVVAFVGTECPLAKRYAIRLVELADEYSPRGVVFLAINANQQDSITELADFARLHAIDFPLLKDPANTVANQFGARRTPEVFVLDKERVVRYRGRIDDQYGFGANGVAYQGKAPQQRDLANALDELLAGKEVCRAEVEGPGCYIGRLQQPDEASDVTYSNQIARIFNQNCVFCHRPGQIAPFSLRTYEECVGWSEMIREVVSQRRMPPWHADPQHGKFSNDARLSDEDLELIVRWCDAGAPQGDASQRPKPPQFTDGWMIPEPDEVVYMRDEPYSVPAEGTIAYKYFTVDPGWTEDRWIKAVQPKPGNPSVVHHIVIYLETPPGPPKGPAGRLRNFLLTAMAPGVRPHVWPDDVAQYAPAGSKLRFEMHYTPNGTEQQDRSFLGIVFADPKKVKKELAVQVAGSVVFRIPPHAPNHRVDSFYQFKDDSLILSMSPHMHLRGKDFLYELTTPDGRKETLLFVPQWDFGWQTTYVLAEPKRVPKGSTLHCVAHYDNSAENRANPDPSATVQWGEQSWEEMMFGWFDMALVDQDLTQSASDRADGGR